MVRFSEEDKATIWEMREAGVPVRRIARHLGRQDSSLRKFIADVGGRRPSPRGRCEVRLCWEEREEVSRGLAAGLSLRMIAHGLGRSPSTVCREVNGNGGRTKYRALRADRASPASGAATQASQAGPVPAAASRGRSASSRTCGLLSRSRRGWLTSIPRRPGDAGVARDDLPVAVRAEPRSAPQGADPRACARGRAMRRRQGHTKGDDGQGQLRGMVDDQSERPAEVADRAVPGHWESQWCCQAA